MSIIHRLAQPDDLNGLLALYRELRPQDAPLRAVTAALEIQEALLVLERADAGSVSRFLREAKVLDSLRARRIEIPLREIASYTLPLLTLDLVLLSMSSFDALLVGNIHGTESVAELRVVESTAKLNSLVFTTFSILFVPTAARLFARNDRAGMRDLYWRTAAWIAVPVAVCFAIEKATGRNWFSIFGGVPAMRVIVSAITATLLSNEPCVAWMVSPCALTGTRGSATRITFAFAPASHARSPASSSPSHLRSRASSTRSTAWPRAWSSSSGSRRS